jgi:putative pyruvate formate lyase activating enzyme
MHRQVGDLRFTADGLACRGLLVRHLVMPGLGDESRKIFGFLAQLSRDTYVNIMGQYHPAHEVGTIASSGRDAGVACYAEINRCPAGDELEGAYEAARAAGLWRFDGRHF